MYISWKCHSFFFIFVFEISLFTCGGGEPVAMHLNETNWPGRTICSLNVEIISGVISVMVGKNKTMLLKNESVTSNTDWVWAKVWNWMKQIPGQW